MILNSDNDEARRLVETCYRKHKTVLNPIIDWKTSDVWHFIRGESIPYCCLYDEGFRRLGCVGCPMETRRGRTRAFNRWPAYKHNYILAFDRMIAEREKRGLIDNPWRAGTTGKAIFRWWIEDRNIEGQQMLWEEE